MKSTHEKTQDERKVEIVSTIKSVSFDGKPEDNARYSKSIYMLEQYSLMYPECDWGELRLCNLKYTRTKNHINSFYHGLSAFNRRETYDAFVYSAFGVISNYKGLLCESLIKAISDACQSEQIANVGRIFHAAVKHDQKDFASYCQLIEEFHHHKSPNFSPYITIPASTVYTSNELPSSSDKSSDQSLSLELGGIISEQYRQSKYKYILVASCDSVYFQKYRRYLLGSLLQNVPSSEYLLVLFLVDGGNSSSIQQCLEEFPRLRNNLLIIPCSSDFDDCAVGPVSSLLRFSMIDQIIEIFNRPVITIDFDIAFKKSPLDLIDKFQGNDMGCRILEKPMVLPWQKYTAGFNIFYPTQNAKFIADAISRLSDVVFSPSETQWWIDQNTLEASLRIAQVQGLNLYLANVVSELPEYLVIPTGSEARKKDALESFAPKAQSI